MNHTAGLRYYSICWYWKRVCSLHVLVQISGSSMNQRNKWNTYYLLVVILTKKWKRIPKVFKQIQSIHHHLKNIQSKSLSIIPLGLLLKTSGYQLPSYLPNKKHNTACTTQYQVSQEQPENLQRHEGHASSAKDLTAFFQHPQVERIHPFEEYHGLIAKIWIFKSQKRGALNCSKHMWENWYRDGSK